MNWNKAKNYTILFLIIINIFLFSFTIVNYFDSRLSGSKISNIVSVLNSKNIAVAADVPKSAPMLSQLSFKAPNYDYYQLTDYFWGSNVTVTRTQEFDKTIFKYGSKTMTVCNSNITFFDSSVKIKDKNEAESSAAQQIKELSQLFEGFEKESDALSDDGAVTISYYGKYKGYTCFNNYCIFTYTSEGMEINLSYSQPVGFYGVKSQVCTADLALFAFSDAVRKPAAENSEGLTVTEIKAGYLTDDDYFDGTVRGLPYYKITAQKDASKESFVMYINGYTGSARE